MVSMMTMRNTDNLKRSACLWIVQSSAIDLFRVSFGDFCVSFRGCALSLFSSLSTGCCAYVSPKK